MWLSPLIIGGTVVAPMTLIYVGSLAHAATQLRGLPVALVNQDDGAGSTPGDLRFGDQVTDGLTESDQVAGALSVRVLDLPQAQQQLDDGQIYVMILIPPGFSESLMAMAGTTSTDATTAVPVPAQITLLTNPRLGSAGVGQATGVLTPALRAASGSIGEQLILLSRPEIRSIPVAAEALRDPVEMDTVQYRPLPTNSALGLSAFYLSLLATMCGFLGATLIHNTVDSALGYAPTELGSTWRLRVPVPLSRWETLLTKWLLALVVVPVFTLVTLVTAVLVVGLDAPGIPELWLFMTLGGLCVAAGSLALLAAFGSIGQLVALILFVYLALASSGATVPTEAIPGFFRFLSHADPLRQLFISVRSIIYFDGSAAAGWPAAAAVLTIELLIWVVLGVTVTRWYDRRGLHRLHPDIVAYVNKSAESFARERTTPST
jgi:YhgE/Pip-like protein